MHWTHLSDAERERRLAILDQPQPPDAYGIDRAFAERHALAAAVREDHDAVVAMLAPFAPADDGPAGDPATPPHLLQQLASSGDVGVRAVIAGNASTPPGALTSLAADDDATVRKAVATNWQSPQGCLRVLADDVDPSVVAAVAQNPFAPADVLVALAGRVLEGQWGEDFNSPRSRVAANAALPLAAIEALARSESRRTWYPALSNLATPAELLDACTDPAAWPAVSHHPSAQPGILARMAAEGDEHTREAVAEHPNAAVETLARLLDDPEWKVRWAAARHPGLPADAARAYFARGDEHDQASIARNVGMPFEVLLELSTNASDYVRQCVLDNPSTPHSLFEQMTSDPAARVRAASARSPRVPVDTLVVLATDADPDVRASAACNPRLPRASLETLAGDPESTVRRAVAEAVSTPPSLLSALAHDDDEWVRQSVAGNMATPLTALADLAADSTERTRLRAAIHPSTPPQTLAALAKDASPEVRATVARSHATSAETLTLLAKDKSAEVRRQLALNRNTPTELLIKFASDKAKGVRLAAIRNPGAPLHAATVAAEATERADAKKPKSVSDRAEEILHGDFTPDVLAGYLDDKAMGIRIAAAIRGFEIGLLDAKTTAKHLKQQTEGDNRLFQHWQQTKDQRLIDVMIDARFDNALEAVARDPATPLERLDQLFELKIPTVGWMIAQRPDLTADQLDVLATTPSHSYQSWEAPGPDELGIGEFYAGGFVSCHPQVIVALHPLTRDASLVKLRKARSKYVRAALAQRPDLDALPTLAKDKDATVRVAVASQGQTPAGLLGELSLDPDSDVRAAVHTNPAAPETARAQAALLGLTD